MVAPQAASSGRCLTDREREHPATEVAEAEPQAHRVAVHRDLDLLAPGQEDLYEPVLLQATSLYRGGLARPASIARASATSWSSGNPPGLVWST